MQFTVTVLTVWLYVSAFVNLRKPLFDMTTPNTWRCVMIRAPCIIDEPSVKAVELSKGLIFTEENLSPHWPPSREPNEAKLRFYPFPSLFHVCLVCACNSQWFIVHAVASHLRYSFANKYTGSVFPLRLFVQIINFLYNVPNQRQQSQWMYWPPSPFVYLTSQKIHFYSCSCPSVLFCWNQLWPNLSRQCKL